MIKSNPKINKENAVTLHNASQENLDWLVERGVPLTKSMSHC